MSVRLYERKLKDKKTNKQKIKIKNKNYFLISKFSTSLITDWKNVLIKN